MPLFLFEQSVMLLGALLQNYRSEGDVPIGPTSNSGPPTTRHVHVVVASDSSRRPTFRGSTRPSGRILNTTGRPRPAVPLTGPPFGT